MEGVQYFILFLDQTHGVSPSVLLTPRDGHDQAHGASPDSAPWTYLPRRTRTHVAVHIYEDLRS
jgi:hypothetical protein